MAEPFLAETRIMSFNFAPKGWAMCNGQFLPINQNQALFSLLGTTFGGNGQTTFALPNLRGRTPIHFNNSHTLGEKAGEEAHTLTISELPAHKHSLNNTNQAVSTNIPAADGILGNTAPNQIYNASGQNLVAMSSLCYFKYWRQSGTFKHAAFSGVEFLYRFTRNFSFSNLINNI